MVLFYLLDDLILLASPEEQERQNDFDEEDFGEMTQLWCSKWNQLTWKVSVN